MRNSVHSVPFTDLRTTAGQAACMHTYFATRQRSEECISKRKKVSNVQRSTSLFEREAETKRSVVSKSFANSVSRRGANFLVSSPRTCTTSNSYAESN